MPWFGEKGMPATSMMYGWHYALTVDQFRKSAHPISMLNPPSMIFAVGNVSAIMFRNYFSKRPVLSATPLMVLTGAAGIWMGYYATRAHHQYYMGKFKYCFEYALSRKEMFPVTDKPRFGDPEYLLHFRPTARP